ncbi:hypothetical protein CLOP_g3332 [Closterium sp. NIES-67]|nr:hypothetical protein CLOP_g3332 [Closterium sp. NIES-67]
MSSPTAAATVARRRRGPSGARAASPAPGTARWRQQRALKAALLAALGAACCVALLRADLPFLAPSARPHEDARLQLPADEGGEAGRVGEDGWPVFGGMRWRGCVGGEDAHHTAMAVLSCAVRVARADGADEGGYLMVQLAGGLNQMRAGICDAVVVARLLGAALMLPLLDNSSWWADGSTFSDVFDAGHFARTLAPWVRVVDRLPSALRGRAPLERTVPRGSTAEYYQTHVRRVMRRAQVVKLNHFDSRLHDHLPAALQKLRCRANYEALRFVLPVTRAVARLTHALTHPAALAASAAISTDHHAARAAGAAAADEAGGGGVGAAQGQGGQREQAERRDGAVKYVAIHLRYEPDMLAFTGCEYGGGAEERALLASIRQRWVNLPAMDAGKQRAKGRCIATPSQVALALQALGFPPSTRLYIASGALHGGPAALRPLLAAFPFTADKLSLARSLTPATAPAHTGGQADDDEDEGDGAWGGGGEVRGGAEGGGALAGVEGRATLLAAVDYEMSRRAAVLLANNNGNMAHLLAGHRRYAGVGSTVLVFGSSVHRLLDAIQQGDLAASHKLRHRLLKGDLNTQGESIDKAIAKGGFYAFPQDCLCRIQSSG